MNVGINHRFALQHVEKEGAKERPYHTPRVRTAFGSTKAQVRVELEESGGALQGDAKNDKGEAEHSPELLF